ncbi:MAG: hypothetical protein ACJKTH_02975 [Patescibacteria group bacterium UBA2163]
MFIPILIFIAGGAFAAPMAESAHTNLVSTSVQATSAEQQIDSLEAYVEDYFADAPILTQIAHCESSMRHLGKDGEILRGIVDSDDIGVMQINTRYHQETADELGINIYSLQGNLEYARYLYDTQGVQPWSASMPCWGHIANK